MLLPEDPKALAEETAYTVKTKGRKEIRQVHENRFFRTDEDD